MSARESSRRSFIIIAGDGFAAPSGVVTRCKNVSPGRASADLLFIQLAHRVIGTFRIIKLSLVIAGSRWQGIRDWGMAVDAGPDGQATARATHHFSVGELPRAGMAVTHFGVFRDIIVEFFNKLLNLQKTIFVISRGIC